MHGVYKKNGLYNARVTINGKHHDICGFKTMEEAHKAYIKLKDETIHSYAILYKDYLPIDLYETLINWSMEKVFKLIEN